MSPVHHSVLLKFFKDTTSMSEKKEGIESRVPKEQEMRGDKEIREEIARAGEVEMKHFSQEPVIQVTREESSFVKGDLKVEKLVVTEDIANGTTTKHIVTVTESGEANEEQTEIYSEMTARKTERDDQRREGFQRTVHRVTRIPQLKFKHTVDKIKKQEEMIKQGRDEVSLALRVAEVVHETKNDRSHLQQIDKVQSPDMEDEFDKIYDEICDGPPSGNFPTPGKIDDSDGLDNKFEEIMNNYDKVEEQKEQAGSGTVKSKIPLLKRKSEQDIDVTKSTLRRNSLKTSSSVDDTKHFIRKLPEPVTTERRKQEESIEGNTVTSLNSDTWVQSETVSVKKFASTKKVTSASETISTQQSHEQACDTENNLITHRYITGSRIPKHFKNINGREKKNEDNKTNRSETKEIKTTTIKDYTITLNIKDRISKVETKPNIIENIKILENNNEITQKDFQQTEAEEQSHTDNTQPETSKVEATSPTIMTTNKEDSNEVVPDKYFRDLDTKRSQEKDSNNTIVEEPSNKNRNNNETTSVSPRECHRDNTLEIRHDTTDIQDDDQLKEAVNVVTLEFPNLLISASKSFSNDCHRNVSRTLSKETTEIKYEGEEKVMICDKNVVKVINQRTEQNHKETEDREDKRVGNNINQENYSAGKEFTIETKKEFQERDITGNKEYIVSKFKNNEEKIEEESQRNITTHEQTEKEINMEEKYREFYIKKLQNMIPEKLEELEEEDIILLKGKVKRVMKRLNSKEFRKRQTETGDLPTDVSVINKIALFEQSKDCLRRDGLEEEDKKDKIHSNKPKIVDEVLKAEDPEANEDERSKRNDSVREESTFSYNAFLNYKNTIKREISVQENKATGRGAKTECHEKYEYNINLNNFTDDKKNILEKIEAAALKDNKSKDILKEYKINKEKDSETKRAKAEADVNYQGVRGRVREMVMRMNSTDRTALERREGDRRRRRQGAVAEAIALFEVSEVAGNGCQEKNLCILMVSKYLVAFYNEMRVGDETTRPGTVAGTRRELRGLTMLVFKKVPAARQESVANASSLAKKDEAPVQTTEEELLQKIAELEQAEEKYGSYENMTYVELSDGARMPTLAVGTALLENGLIKPIIKAAIALGYRAIDSAFVYGNERAVGEAIREKIQDGTVRREDLFIISKLWSTSHRRDLVPSACRQSLDAMGLDYFDLYLIHNPMSFKEGANLLPKIANVLQYSDHDYLDAWFGVESCIKQGLVKRGGVSNFNSVQVQRVLDKGRIRPVINQVECHPYLSQTRLHDYLVPRGVSLSCYGVLGSSGTPRHLRSPLPPVINDPLVRTMAAGLGVTPAQLLISYQVHMCHHVVVKASSAGHLRDNLLSLELQLEPAHVAALSALNRNKRTFTFQG
ncbi:seminal fluid protein CSSFP011 isoform 2, partial [Danaus plexippus plexippus]